MSIDVSKHPLVVHKVNTLRRIKLSTEEFRETSKELTTLLMYEATRDLCLKKRRIKHWLGYGSFSFLPGKKLVIIPILRAGIGMLAGALRITPGLKTGCIGIYRDHQTFEAIRYYVNLPNKMNERIAFILDPMLATGNTLVAAVDIVKDSGCKDIRAVCFVAAPEGLKQLTKKHPDLKIYVAAIDEKLNNTGYILPGLGDAGDRMLGVK
jgi:uracil phosphoribosyltransferase